MKMEQIAKKIKETVEQEMNREAEGIAMYEIVKKALTPFEGKPVSKRMVTAIKKGLPADSIVYLDNGYSKSISIWGAGRPYDQRITFYLPSAPLSGGCMFTMGKWTPDGKDNSGFIDSSACYGEAAKIRNNTRAKFLKNAGAIAKTAEAIYNKMEADKAYEAMRYPDTCESFYAIARVFEIK